MKFKCLTYHLKEALALTEKISNKNITLPILNSVLISTKKKELKIIVTNLEVGIEIKIPAKIEQEGENAVPAKLLYNFLSNLPSSENIELENFQNNLNISNNNTSTIIKGYSVEDFPLLPSIKEKEEFLSLPIKDFLEGPTNIGLPISLNSESLFMISRLCSNVLPNPMPGSTIIFSSFMPSFVAFSIIAFILSLIS